MPLPDIAAAFDALADGYDDDPHHGLIAERLVAGLRSAPPPGLVVDVATGTGAAAFAALRLLAPARLVAVDVSPRMIARARAKDPDGRVEWRVAPAVPLGLRDGAADVVLCASSLHFLGAAALRDWRRVLRPGGQVAFSLPVAGDFRPSPGMRLLLPGDLTVPADATAAARIATDAGFAEVRATITATAAGGRARRAFLVHALAPPVA